MNLNCFMKVGILFNYWSVFKISTKVILQKLIKLEALPWHYPCLIQSMNTFILSFLLVCGLNTQSVNQPFSNYGDALDQMQSLEDTHSTAVNGQSCEYKNFAINNQPDVYVKADADLNLELQEQVKLAKVKTHPKKTINF
jgi:hypothetical protein